MDKIIITLSILEIIRLKAVKDRNYLLAIHAVKEIKRIKSENYLLN